MILHKIRWVKLKNKVNIKNILNFIEDRKLIEEGYLLFILIGMFFLTRQLVFPHASTLALVSIITSFIAAVIPLYKNFSHFEKKEKILFIGYYIFMTLILVYSLFIVKNKPYYAIHTYATCVLLIMAYIYPKNKKIVDIFIWVMVIHALVLIFIEIYMILNYTPEFASRVRNYIIGNGFGDIYTRNGIYFRAILRGNELLLIPYMILWRDKTVRARIKRIILLLGIIVSGNMAYFISLAIFYLLNIILIDKNYKVIKIMLVACSVIFIIFNKPIISKVHYTFQLKMEKSFPTRIDQVNVLIDDMESVTDVILGKGMGNTLNAVTKYRNYTGDRYFELQSIYFYNQLGLIGFSIFVFLHLFLTYKFIKNRFSLIIYFCYLTYAVTNPYIFNLTHLIIILVLTSMDNSLNNKDTYIKLDCENK